MSNPVQNLFDALTQIDSNLNHTDVPVFLSIAREAIDHAVNNSQDYPFECDDLLGTPEWTLMRIMAIPDMVETIRGTHDGLRGDFSITDQFVVEGKSIHEEEWSRVYSISRNREGWLRPLTSHLMDLTPGEIEYRVYVPMEVPNV